jgi:hypothetical protein
MSSDMYQGGWQQSPYPPGPPPRSSSNAALWALVALLSIFLVIAVIGGIWWFTSSRTQAEGERTAVTVTATAEAPAPSPTAVTVTAEAPAPTPAPAPAPSSGVPGTLISTGGYLENVWVGSSNTSEAFAMNVWNAYLENRAVTGLHNATVYAWSPATGQSYAMNCRETGSYVTCTGGNNAVVYIS